MMRALQHLRDFLDEQTLKQLPNSLMTGQFILLKHSIGGKSRKPLPLCPNCELELKEKGKVTYCPKCKKDQKAWDEKYPLEPWRQVIEVFDQGGTWIGQISDPDWIPSTK